MTVESVSVDPRVRAGFEDTDERRESENTDSDMANRSIG